MRELVYPPTISTGDRVAVVSPSGGLPELFPAVFEPGEVEIHPAPSYTDEDRDWGDAAQLALSPNMWPNPGWEWVNADRTIEGVTWGGCLEILDYQLRTGRYLPRGEDCDGAIVVLETSEELP